MANKKTAASMLSGAGRSAPKTPQGAATSPDRPPLTEEQKAALSRVAEIVNPFRPGARPTKGKLFSGEIAPRVMTEMKAQRATSEQKGA